MKIHQLKLRLSNAYLILGEKPILVDTGSPGDTEAIRSKLKALDIRFSDLAMIVHTHVHSDHMGSTAAIVQEAKCPVAYHVADQAVVDRATNGSLKGVGLRGKIMARIFSRSAFQAVNADLFLKHDMRLNDYGCDVRIIETPSHTPGSISIITPDGQAIIGDVIMGGIMGGKLFPHRPNYHYFADDISQAMASLDLILSQTHNTLYVGHGGPHCLSNFLSVVDYERETKMNESQPPQLQTHVRLC